MFTTVKHGQYARTGTYYSARIYLFKVAALQLLTITPSFLFTEINASCN